MSEVVASLGAVPEEQTEESKSKVSSTVVQGAIGILGGIFILNSFIITSIASANLGRISDWANDGGVLASACAAIGITILLVQLFVFTFKSEQNIGLHILVILAVLASIAWAGSSISGVISLQTAGATAFFMLLSLLVESHSAVGAKSSLEELLNLTPGKARKILDGVEQAVDPEDLQAGDFIQVYPGETVYADGIIETGITALQEANITGESLPVDKTVGASVFAGTVNLSGMITVRVERAGKETTIGKVRELIMDAQGSKLGFVRLIDQYVKFYTPVILMIALIVWFATGYELARVAALLVAACPLALILATPSVMLAGLSAAARLGILVKNVSDIESLSRVNACIFDKTGTITTGELGAMRIAMCEGFSNADMVRYSASAEQKSSHPVARAVCTLADRARIPLVEPDELHEQAGRGLRAKVDGHIVHMGNMAWMEENGVEEADFPDHDQDTQGVSMLYVMCDGKAMGWIALEDTIRDNAEAVIKDLESLGVRHIAIVTGDRKAVADRVAHELEIRNYSADCVPQDKVDYIEDIRSKGYHTLFCGDGVNDGPALAASNIGVAMGAAGSDVAIESASIALLNSRLNRLPFLLKLSRHARNIIIQNFVVGGIFIFGGMILSAMGILVPLHAAIIQLISSIIIVLNSARLVREGEDIDA
ncbi:MAG: cation-translocating P-type ATPase [Lentisphaeria bacterium]|nr:cation-translocating P-type ATPase [Lentisphaeria bacterium]